MIYELNIFISTLPKTEHVTVQDTLFSTKTKKLPDFFFKLSINKLKHKKKHKIPHSTT